MIFQFKENKLEIKIALILIKNYLITFYGLLVALYSLAL